MADNLCSIVPSSAGASEQAIQAHYDVSNDFYALWLDSSMAYSCALWDDEDAGDTLHLAQLRKFDYHLSEAQAHGKARLLDVGSGWGALLERAVTHYGVGHAVGLTLSRAQADWVAQSASERVSVLLESWADHAPEASYDAIVSIGAFEHFAKIGLPKAQKIEAYRRFFKWCHEHASDNCTLSLQSIVYENYDEQNPNPFVEEIFPESELPRLSEILAACEGLFEVTRMRNDRHHYARTLQVWYANLRKHRDEAIAQVGEAVYKKYEKYLGIFVVGFHTGTVNLARLTARKIASPSVAR
ncbi:MULTISPECIES: cyclopropane-fatty-acyl-phospholipid synthase family protein [unclassified Paraburkholderia]|uniref:cyclopropane-fatty-acyl-phospholipid synthase family protein n=1 Tax=unclassified Paraburkholderia TaxID=2615204 RepID=UPI0017C25E35|nr:MULTISPECIES: cyclopropane-fatty-acyl-phospholipid synthase family protein [unclassified Paraburkholderia]MBB5447922.1 cyclopropane-fatty-acyl-phospholipid synthase [Paraburkholderia sp. WSM4177]MBB5488298.1 cyclopropane-fatty-acyl-phospholipid synthase [Paraburkholderia sp. WSM4180]